MAMTGSFLNDTDSINYYSVVAQNYFCFLFALHDTIALKRAGIDLTATVFDVPGGKSSVGLVSSKHVLDRNCIGSVE